MMYNITEPCNILGGAWEHPEHQTADYIQQDLFYTIIQENDMDVQTVNKKDGLEN